MRPTSPGMGLDLKFICSRRTELFPVPPLILLRPYSLPSVRVRGRTLSGWFYKLILFRFFYTQVLPLIYLFRRNFSLFRLGQTANTPLLASKEIKLKSLPIITRFGNRRTVRRIYTFPLLSSSNGHHQHQKGLRVNCFALSKSSKGRERGKTLTSYRSQQIQIEFWCWTEKLCRRILMC